MRQTCPPAPLLTWSRDFPAVPPQAREARLFLAARDGDRTDDEGPRPPARALIHARF